MAARRKTMQEATVREEVLNVALADVLSERELVSIPETIVQATRQRGRKLPDVTIGDLWGVRIVIEGRVEENTGVRTTVFRDAKKRVTEGLAPICLAVLYPPELRQVGSLAKLNQALTRARLTVRVISEGSDGDWFETTVDGMTDVLRRSYELLVSEDVVSGSVVEIENAIDAASAILTSSKATPSRLRIHLGIPEETLGSKKSKKGVDEEEE
ncbi:MAG TPA: hypothetical protein VGV59_08725 [Pyrinomonadaceae bacterium]|nr:hypothetical protein [Pyrinomonadaceae bacterium]